MDDEDLNHDSEDCLSSDNSIPILKHLKPKKRSLVERELETNLTAHVTSPISNGDTNSHNTSRYGRARKLKTDADFCGGDKIKNFKCFKTDKSPLKSPGTSIKMFASNSPLKIDANTNIVLPIESQIECRYNENISLSLLNSDSEKTTSPKKPRVYVRKDIQCKDKEETATLIKNMFSPSKTPSKTNHLSLALDRSTEKYDLPASVSTNCYLDNNNVVKALNFDNDLQNDGCTRHTNKMSQQEISKLEASCAYDVGDLAWARIGSYPFWPCIITRDPYSDIYVKKKSSGRLERNFVHVTFFGDNGRRGWVSENMLRKYLGQLEFEMTREKFTLEEKKKDPKLYAAFFVSEKKQQKWNVSVEEAECFLREDKIKRLDLLYDMLIKIKGPKTTPKRNKSIKMRKDSDVSLSESLLDTLFSEDDTKTDDIDRNKSRKKSLDVSEVVTACLDNMAAKTGITKIKKQSHMDRWLQKAKSKTPEKTSDCKIKTKKDGQKKSTKSKSQSNMIQTSLHLNKNFPVFNLNKSIDGNISYNKINEHSQNGLLWFQNHISKEFPDEGQRIETTYNSISSNNEKALKDDAKYEKQSTLCTEELKNGQHSLKTLNNGEISNFMNGSISTVYSSEDSSEENNFEDTSIKKAVQKNENINEDSVNKICTSNGNDDANGLEDLQIVSVFSIAEECNDITVKKNTNANELFITENVGKNKFIENDYIVNNSPQKDINNENILQNKIQSLQLKLLNKNEEHTTKQINGISSLDKNKVVDDLQHIEIPHLECNSLPTVNRLSTNSEQKLPTINKTDNILLESPVKTQKKSLSLRKKFDESLTEKTKLDSIEKCNKTLNCVLHNEKLLVQNTVISENLLVIGNAAHPQENSPKRKKQIGVANDAQASTSTEFSLNCAEGNTVGNVDLAEKCDSTKDETIVPVNGCIKNQKESQNSIRRKSILDETEIGSEDEIPISKRVLRIRHNTENVSKSISSIETNVTDSYDKFNRSYDDPEFLKYMKDSQDPLMEENPHLTHNEIVAYLYRTWIFDQDQKSESTKNDSVPHVDLVKGLSEDHIQIQYKKPKKRIKMDREPQFRNEDVVREKVERETRKKNVKPFYNEAEDTDTDSEYLEFQDSVPNSGQITANNDDRELVMDHSEHEVVDEVEFYFEQLTQYKPNLFKGLIRERVCDVCEKPGNLSKCKGPCGGFYHGDCAKKEIEQEESHVLHRGRKKKKSRGRKSKADNNNDCKFNGTDSESQEDKSQDNISFDDSDKLEFTCRIEINESDFDAKTALQLKEMMKEYQDDSEDYSNDEWDFEDIVAGKCKIVDVKVRKRTDETADSNHYSDFKCNMCLKYDTPLCFVCKSILSPKGNTEFRQRCNVAHCQKYYHTECLEHWPQAHFSAGEPSKNNKKISEHYETLTCPRHVCHTCVSDDPRGCKTRFSGDKLAKCVRCPAVYHSLTRCLPAGSLVLNASNIICTRHREGFGKVPSHVNTSWCFLCAQGGSLICCEYCPTSFHPECLKFKPPEGGYMCEDCETGRLPLYGEMVWAKLGHFRWWPGIILHPSEVPKKIMLKKHCTPGEFVVRFFGQYDHYWMNRGRVFRFQEGDSGRISSQKSKIDDDFMLAVDHAKRANEILKDVQPNEEEELEIQASVLPPYYVKLKVNKPIGGAVRCKVDMSEANSMTQCECDPNDYEPCGPESQCLNRMLLTECGPSCRAGDRCCNRNFEKRIYPKMIPYRTPHRGWGLKTLQDIKKGQFVIEYVGELIDEEEFRRRMRRKHEIRDENFYFLTLDKDRMIDAGPKGNLARFMNHCCEPNCETQKWTVLGDVRVGLFALHDIKANTEVTFNYNLECAGIEKKQCMCGAARCSGYIGAKPKQDDSQSKKKTVTKRVYRKRKIESPSLSKPAKTKPKSKPKPRELTEIEKDLLIIQSATNSVPSDSESNYRLNMEKESTPKDKKNQRALKRKRVSFSTEEVIIYNGVAKPTNVKRLKLVDEPLDSTPITI